MPDKSGELLTQEGAQRYIEYLKKAIGWAEVIYRGGMDGVDLIATPTVVGERLAVFGWSHVAHVKTAAITAITTILARIVPPKNCLASLDRKTSITPGSMNRNGTQWFLPLTQWFLPL